MRVAFLVVTALTLCVSTAQAEHHASGSHVTGAVIGSSISEDGSTHPLTAGDTAKQQIWLDYIAAHNERDLEKIAFINADDWEGYTPDGAVIHSNKTHIAWLDAWFKSGDNPRWVVRWMIASSGLNAEGAAEHWLTTGNDITFNDAEGNRVTEHHVHDVQFMGDQIKQVYVYSRPQVSE